MMILIIVHVIICAALIALVLIQRGRGGGLVESFSGVESMFGTKTNEFLTRATTILSILFFITCLSLAILSVRQSKSLMRNVAPQQAPAGVRPLTEPAKENTAAQSAAQTPQGAQAQVTPQPEQKPEAPKTE